MTDGRFYAIKFSSDTERPGIMTSNRQAVPMSMSYSRQAVLVDNSHKQWGGGGGGEGREGGGRGGGGGGGRGGGGGGYHSLKNSCLSYFYFQNYTCLSPPKLKYTFPPPPRSDSQTS